MNHGYLLLSKANKSAALSSREAHKSGCKFHQSEKGFQHPKPTWEVGTARSKQGTSENGRDQCVRRLRGTSVYPLGRDRVQVQWTPRVGSSGAVRGVWFEQSCGNLVGCCAPRPGVLAGCFREIGREGEE